MKAPTPLLAAAAALLMCGCAATTPAAVPTPTPTPTLSSGGAAAVVSEFNARPRDQLRDGGTLVTAVPTLMLQMNPFHVERTPDGVDMWDWFNPVLSHRNPDGSYVPDPDYLTSVTHATIDDKAVVTYQVNGKAAFNDGTPIDVEAFRAVHSACTEGPGGAHACASSDGWSRIESIKAGASAKEVVVTFTGPEPWWQGLFTRVLHPKAAEPETFEVGYRSGRFHPEWGAGPFRVDNLDVEGGVLSLVRNEKWWGDPARLTLREFRVMARDEAAKAFAAGRIHAVSVADEKELEAASKADDSTIRRGTGTDVTVMMLNSASPLLSDDRVREALMRGTDREALRAAVFTGLSWDEPSLGSLVVSPHADGYHDNVADVVAHDPKRAVQLLEDAGWHLAEGASHRVKDGETLRVTMPVFGNWSLFQRRADELAQQWERIGVQLRVVQHPLEDFTRVMDDRQQDVAVVTLLQDDAVQVSSLCQTYCRRSLLNTTGTGTPQIDGSISMMQKLGSAQAQVQRANEIERDALATHGALPLYSGPHMVATRSSLANFGATAFGTLPVADVGWEK